MWASYNKRDIHTQNARVHAAQKPFLLLWLKTPKRPVTGQCKLRQRSSWKPSLFGVNKQWTTGVNCHWVGWCGLKTKTGSNSQVLQLSVTAQPWVPSQSCPLYFIFVWHSSASQPLASLLREASLGWAQTKLNSQALAFCSLPLLAASCQMKCVYSDLPVSVLGWIAA